MWLEASRAIENSSHTNSECCLSVFDKEQGKSKQLSYKLLSINFHLCFTRSKESQNNFHTNFCLSTLIFVWRGARKVKTTFTQTLVYQLSSILIFVWPGARKVKTTFTQTLIFVWPGAKKVKTTFIQTFVYQLTPSGLILVNLTKLYLVIVFCITSHMTRPIFVVH